MPGYNHPADIARFVFVVDTDHYAGSFQRELCAFVTGTIGECGVGKEDKKLFEQDFPDENPFENSIDQCMDMYGCHRPVVIWSTPGWFNWGIVDRGMNFRDGQEAEAEADRQKYYAEEVKRSWYVDESANERARAECRARAQRPMEKCPAFMSVGILFHEKPTDDLVCLMKERSARYCQEHDIPLTGFRFFKLEVVETEISLEQA